MSDKKESSKDLAPIAPTDANYLLVMNRMIEKGVDPDAMKKWMDLLRDIQDRQAQAAYARAMNECQSAMPAVVKNMKNQHGKMYADLEAVNDAIKPIYAGAGFSVCFSEDVCPTMGSARIVATLNHVGGHSAKFWADVPIDGAGAKGNASGMNATQGKGSTLAYARRYLLYLIFNLTLTDEDTDGHGSASTLDQDQIKVINELCEDCRLAGQAVDFPRFLTWLLGEGVEGDLGNVPTTKFALAVDFLNRKLRKIRAEMQKGDASE